jgi:ADP-ribose pyrophosphatase YjhB (NUDIX family)
MRRDREYPSHPLVGTGALIHRAGRVFLLRRRWPPNEGYWAFPGGLVEPGESVQDAVLREVKEETGLKIKLDSLLDVVTDIHLDEAGRVKYHYVIVDYTATPSGQRVRLNDESSSWGWFTPDEIKKIKVSRNTRECVKKFDMMSKRRRGVHS